MNGPARRVLISSFEPFGGLTYNPSSEVAAEVASAAETELLVTQREHGPVAVSTVVLPVEFTAAAQLLIAAVQKHRPDVVISVGLAAGTESVRLERVGLNLRDARIPDNAGAQPLDEAIVEGGPNAYFSTLRLKAAHQRILAAGIPASLSLSAGSYLCNEVLDTILHHIDAEQLPVAAGFLHIPDLRSPDLRGPEAPVTHHQAAAAVDLTISESLKSGPDAAAASGALH